MKSIKTVIVDDEILARKRITKLLSHDPEVHIVAEFNKGAEAIEFIESHHVDILFLDIHMPEVDGFSVLKRLSEDRKPFVIFATADKDSALKAFEYKALDYLLKPFRTERFYNAVNSAKEYVQLRKKAMLSDQMAGLINEFSSPSKSKLKVSEDTTLNLDDILFIKSDGNYLRFYEKKDDYKMVRKTMSELISEIDMNDFLRIHRSVLINTYFISDIKYIGNNEFDIMINNEIKLKSSRSFKEEIIQYQNTING